MTLLGKILLYTNLALSIAMAAWGMALYTGRINWTNKSATTDAPEGELHKLLEEKKLLDPVLTAANARYRNAADQLLTTYQQRQKNVAQYGIEAERLQTKATKEQPAN